MRSLSGGRLGRLALLCAIAGALLAPQVASAAPASVFGGAVPCAAQPDGVTFCSDSPRSTVPAWDGVPIDVNVGLPNEAQFGPGPYPLMMMFHGYGGDKLGLGSMQRWLDRGYATFSMSDRGFHESCGSPESQAASGGACASGYIRLIDNRYEVRDAQEFAGQLADEGLIDPQRIGSIGGSYGGGMSMALGALRNRKVMPD
jgi:cephalosporin-C deacetylase-like acetyl esterase